MVMMMMTMIIIIIIIIIYVTANRPDIIKNKKGKAYTLIDVATPADRMLCKRKRKRS